MLRSLLIVAFGLSLLLCVAASALWVRSYWVSDRYGWLTERPTPGGTTSRELTYWNVGTYGGVLQVQSEVRTRGAPEYIAVERADLTAGQYKQNGVALGYLRGQGVNPGTGVPLVRWRSRGTNTTFLAQIRLWLIAAVAATLAGAIAVHVSLRRKLARRSQQQCVACGYDMRASPIRCPECGREANAAMPAA